MPLIRWFRRLTSRKIDLRVGLFLALREVRRANKWTTLLIIAVMTLTFLNLTVVGGILVGLIEGGVRGDRDRYSGDVIISTPLKKEYIERSQEIVAFLKTLPEVDDFSTRYLDSGTLQTGYKTRSDPSEQLDQAGAVLVGIDPDIEARVTGLNRFVRTGDYLQADDYDQVLVGQNLLFNYTPIDSPGFQNLKDVDAGSKVRLVVGSSTREVTIKGVINAKAANLDQQIYMTSRQLRTMLNRSDYNVDEIAVMAAPGVSAERVQQLLINQGFGSVANIQTAEEALPKFLRDIKAVFALLGNVIGGIGLAVASITIFIVIFVNAITRRRYIGIMKGIGINRFAIEFSYILQSLFYAIIGMVLGSLILFLVLQPYFEAYPLKFPFSDGILVATPLGTAVRALVLFFATMIAGYIPARIVAKQNTLDAILGR
jgi:putative ABC transport system permease protein